MVLTHAVSTALAVIAEDESRPSTPPPSYECSAVSVEAWPHHCEALRNDTSQLGLELNTSEVDYGSFLFGSLYIRPLEDIPAGTVFYLRIEHMTYVVRHLDGPAPSEQTEKSINVLHKSRICTESVLTAGLVWRMPFNVRFPTESELPVCVCNSSHHLTAPPSIGSHNMCILSVPRTHMAMGYHVRANTKLFPEDTSSKFLLRPQLTTMSLASFRDPSGLKVLSRRSAEHEFAQWKKLAGLPLVKTTSKAKSVKLEGWPCFLTRGENSPDYFTVLLRDEGAAGNTMARCKIKHVKYSVRKYVFASADRFADYIDNSCLAKRVTVAQYGPVVPKEKWDGAQCELTVVLDNSPQDWNMSPSYIGCHSAVLYDLSVYVSHSRGTSYLQIPLCLNNSQTMPPSYDNVVCDELAPNEKFCSAFTRKDQPAVRV